MSHFVAFLLPGLSSADLLASDQDVAPRMRLSLEVTLEAGVCGYPPEGWSCATLAELGLLGLLGSFAIALLVAFHETFVKTGELPSAHSTVVGNPQCFGEELELALLPASGQLIEQRPDIAQLYVDVETPQL